MTAFLRILNVSREELPLVFSMIAIYFTLIFGNLLAINAGNTLFSFNFGGTKYLPYMFLILGVVTCLIAIFMTFFADRFPRIKAMQVLCALLFLFAVFIHQGHDYFSNGHLFYYPLIYLGIQISWLLTNMQYWLIANEICDTREAKRLFSLFSAGGILAGCFAGLFASFIVKYLATRDLILFWAFLLLGVIFLLNLLKGRFSQRLIQGVKKEDSREEPLLQNLKKGLQYLFADPLLKTMAIVFCLLQILIFNTDYFFINIMTALSTDSTNLAGIFGWVRASSSLIALLIQLFLTSRIIAFLGVGNSFLIFPVTLLVNFLLMGFLFNESMAIFARTSRIVLVTSLFIATQNILYSPLPPVIRGRIRTLISIFFEPLGIALSGLIFLTMAGRFTLKEISLFSAFIAFITIALSFMLRKYYVQSLVKTLETGSHEMQFEALEFLGQEKNSLQPLAQALKSSDSQIRLNAAIALGQTRNEKSLPFLVEVIHDRDEEVRDAVCDAIGKLGGHGILKPLLEQLAIENVKKVKATIIKSISRLKSDEVKEILLDNLKDTDTRVIANTIEALQNFYEHRDVLDTVQPFLSHSHHRVRANTAVLLVKSSLRNYQMRGTDTLTKMLYSRKKLMRSSALVGFAEINNEKNLANLVNALGDEEADVRFNAVRAIRRLGSPRAIRDLLDMSNDTDHRVRQETLNALTSFGDRVVPLLMEIIEKEGQMRRQTLAIEALGRLGNRESISPLLKLVDSPVAEIAQAAISAINGIKDPSVIDPLIPYLEGDTQPRVKAAILNVLGGFKDQKLKKIYLKLLSDDSDRIRSNALDALEKLQDPNVAEKILPLLEDRSPRVRATAARILDRLGYPQGIALLKEMLGNPDKWTKISALYALGELGRPDFTMLMVDYMSDPDPDIKRNARLALEKMGSSMVLSGGDSSMDIGALKTLSKYSLAPLLEAIKNEDSKVRNHALKILQDLPDLKDLDPLYPLLKNSNTETLILTLDIFAKYPQDRYLEGILNALFIEDDEVRLSAIRALRGFDREMIKGPLAHFSGMISERSLKIQGQLKKVMASGERVLIEKLGQGLKRELDSLVKMGLEILATLHDPKTILVIEKNLKDPNPRTRANAIEALDSIGEKAIVSVLIPILEAKMEFSKDEDRGGIFHIMSELLDDQKSGLKEKTMEAIEEFGIQRMMLPFLSLSNDETHLVEKRSLFFKRLQGIISLEETLVNLDESEQKLLKMMLFSLDQGKDQPLNDLKKIMDDVNDPKTLRSLLNCFMLIAGDKALSFLITFIEEGNTLFKKEAFTLLLEHKSDEARKLVLEYYKKDRFLTDIFDRFQTT